jgi:hypothetical protein
MFSHMLMTPPSVSHSYLDKPKTQVVCTFFFGGVVVRYWGLMSGPCICLTGALCLESAPLCPLLCQVFVKISDGGKQIEGKGGTW